MAIATGTAIALGAAGALGAGALGASASRSNTRDAIENNNRAMDQILALPQPEARNLEAELTGNAEVMNTIGQQWTGNANELAGTIGQDWRAQNEAANPELYALMTQQDAGPGYTHLNPDDFLEGGRFYQGADGSIGGVGGGGGGAYTVNGFERLNPMMISQAARYSPINVNAQQITAPDDVEAQQMGELQDRALLEQLNSQAMGQGYSPLMQQLAGVAESELALGGQVSEQEARNAREGLRTAQVARGIYEGNGAMADEILNLDAVQRQRLNERLAMGLNVQGAQEQALQGQRDFGLGVQSANQSLDQLNTDRLRADQSADLQAQTVTASNQLSAAQSNQDAALRAAMANQSAGLQANQQYLQGLLADQSANLSAQQYNSSTALNLAQSNAAARRSAAAQAQANEMANIERYLAATEYNNELAGQEFEAGQAAVGNRMATQINPYNLALDITNPYNSYAENLHMGNYQGAWSGYNAQANALAGNAAGNAAISGAGAAANAGIWGSAISGLTGIGAAYVGGRGE